MIRYTLKCREGHAFESWFSTAEGYEELRAAGHVTCAVCGSAEVEKSLMAPAVSAPAEAASLKAAASPQEVALKKFKAHLDKNSDYVGRDFATRARAMHDGTEPDRAIHGEASFEEAKSLVEDGVPVTPLPFQSPRRTN
ncbi:MAG: DUF1178 family protein [Pseudomonadota bacterium]